MSIKALITPEVLAWARNSAGYSVDQIVEKINQRRVSRTTIEAWEKGEDTPTYPQLEKLAGYYKRSIAVFYFPSPPKEDDVNSKFRSLPEFYLQSLPPKILYLIREASAKQFGLYELYGNMAPENTHNFTDLPTTFNLVQVKKIADQVRNSIGVSLETQCR